MFWTVSIQQRYVRVYVRGRQRRAKRVRREFRRVSFFGLVKINELCPWCETRERNSPGFLRREPVIRRRVHSAVMLSPGLLVVIKKGTKVGLFYFLECVSFFIFPYLRNVWVYPWTFLTAAAGSTYVRTIKQTSDADCYDKPRRPWSVRHISWESKHIDLEHNALQPHSVVVGGGRGFKKENIPRQTGGKDLSTRQVNRFVPCLESEQVNTEGSVQPVMSHILQPAALYHGHLLKFTLAPTIIVLARHTRARARL